MEEILGIHICKICKRILRIKEVYLAEVDRSMTDHLRMKHDITGKNLDDYITGYYVREFKTEF